MSSLHPASIKSSTGFVDFRINLGQAFASLRTMLVLGHDQKRKRFVRIGELKVKDAHTATDLP
jgi:hypothetical protein